MDHSLPGFSLHGILLARILLWRIFPTQGSNPGFPHCRRSLYCLSHQGSHRYLYLCTSEAILFCKHNTKNRTFSKDTLFFLKFAPLEHLCACMLTAQSCLTLCDPMNYSSPGSSVQGMLQARILEWVAFPFSGGSSQPRDRTQVSRIAGRFFTS